MNNSKSAQITKSFIIKGLVESLEIQESYNARDYFNAVLKCRVFLESWLAEYIMAIIFPEKGGNNDENRRFVSQRFSDIFYQIQWLLQNGYISKSEHDNINKIRIFSERVFRKNDVLTIYSIQELDKYIEAAVYYCNKFKNLTKELIESPRSKNFSID
jgi:hypothetical protein